MKPTAKKTVMKMREEYEKTIRKSSTENLKKKFPDRPWIEEAASSWVSRKDLEALLNANNADGLRIYYGCHHISTNSNSKYDYLGLHNLILVATKDSVDAKNPKTQTSVDQLKDIEEDAQILTYDGAAGTDIEPCPPVCPTPPPPPPPPPTEG